MGLVCLNMKPCTNDLGTVKGRGPNPLYINGTRSVLEVSSHGQAPDCIPAFARSFKFSNNFTGSLYMNSVEIKVALPKRLKTGTKINCNDTFFNANNNKGPFPTI